MKGSFLCMLREVSGKYFREHLVQEKTHRQCALHAGGIQVMSRANPKILVLVPAFDIV